jgi:hypothetical protein
MKLPRCRNKAFSPECVSFLEAERLQTMLRG